MNWEISCELLLDILNSQRATWPDASDVKKTIICSWFYDHSFRWGGHDKDNHTGLISADAVLALADGKKTTKDHWFNQRLLCRFMMDDNQWVLDDPEEFKTVFRLSQSTITVTPDQNQEVKFSNRDGMIVINELTINKYNNFRFMKEGSTIVVDGFPPAEKMPEWFTNSEKKYLIRG